MFDVGDRVVCVRDYPDDNPSIVVGDAGEVCYILDEETIGVRWDNKVRGGHACDGHCEAGHGWYVKDYEIELEAEDIICDETEILSFLEVKL